MSADLRLPPRYVKEIRAHLTANPQALDTADGIARWWIGITDLATAHEAIETALLYLEQQGVIQRKTLADGKVIFGAAQTLTRREKS